MYIFAVFTVFQTFTGESHRNASSAGKTDTSLKIAEQGTEV